MSGLHQLYEMIETTDFSREVLQRVSRQLSVVRVPACGWSDLGTPARLQAFLNFTEGIRAVAAALQIYFKDELKWETDEKYYVWGNVRPRRQDPDPRVGEMLRRAMTQNPFLEVLVLQGYYDGGTDYYSAQYTIAHLDPGGALNSRFRFAFYESVHTMYLKQSELAKTKLDLVKFIQTATGAGQ